MAEKNQKRQVTKISVFIISIFVIVLSISYAFINQTLTGTKRQVITSGNLKEGDAITLENALPMYDEVGMIGEPFHFRLTNKGSESVDYTITLEDVAEGTNKLDTRFVKYGLEKDGTIAKDLLSNLTDYVIDTGVIAGNQTIEYNLRFWIDSSVEDETLIENKTLSYKLNIEGIRKPTEKKKVFLATMRQGDYVAYVGNNGCMKNGESITGDSDAENGNSCLGYNANAPIDGMRDANEKYGYCHSSNYRYNVTGWRIAYIEKNRTYLISAGSPECNIKPSSVGNIQYIQLANEKSKKYCNPEYVEGDCSDNSDSWAIGDEDFYKMTSVINNGEGRHLVSYYGSSSCSGISDNSCGLSNSLIDNGGFYWFAAASNSSEVNGVYWLPNFRYVNYYNYTSAYGLRPIIRLSSSVVVTGGSGTMDEPWQIANS